MADTEPVPNADSPCGVTAAPAEKWELLRELYRKHGATLQAIEESQHKLILVLLGVFSAGSTYVASDKALSLHVIPRIGLTIVTLGVLWVGWRYTAHLDVARKGVRELLVACEKALGLYDRGFFCSGSSLYGPELKNYPEKGVWLNHTFWVAALAAAGFVFLLWAPYLVLKGSFP